MMVVAVIVFMLFAAEEGSDLHGFSFLGFACWDVGYSCATSIAGLGGCSMVVTLGRFQHSRLGRLAVDLQAQLAASARST